MRLVILTSNSLRHKYFINYLSKRNNVVGVVMEDKKRKYDKKGEGTKHQREVKNYFDERSESEKYFFGDNDNLVVKEKNILKISGGELNDNYVVEMIKKWRADYVAVFGTSLLKKEIISFFPEKRIINMHLGLSPYYRGSGTNFWPLYDKKPQYVGVTVHFLDKGIDTGDIIVQGRPEIEIGDTPHSIGNKAIEVGVRLTSKVFEKIKNGEIVKGEKQELEGGKLCLFKNFKSWHIAKLTEAWSKNYIENYLCKKDQVYNIELVDTL